MNHFILIQLFLSGGTGLVVFSLYYLYSLFKPSVRLSYFLALQLSIVFIIGLNVFHTYTLANIGANRVLLVISYCCSLFWSPSFILFTGLFFVGMGGQDMPAAARRSLSAFGLAVGALSFLPFAFARSIESILAYQRIIHRCAVIPLCGLTQVIFSARFFFRARREDNAVHKALSRFALCLNLTATIVCVLAVNISIATGNARIEIDLVVMDIYFFAWNILCLMAFFGFDRVFMEKMKESSRPKRLRAEKPLDAAMPKDWAAIESVIGGKRLFVKPRLDLSFVSRETRIPKNRISTVVNRCSGKPFNDYVNSLRIEEFKRILRAPGYSGNILKAAFDAGFNSKATFYFWFRKIEKERPGDSLKKENSTERRIDRRSAP
jgi:AraC-like DNA-binding protein